MERNDLVRLLLGRMATHKDTASEMDYPRIEELCWLTTQVVQGMEKPIEVPYPVMAHPHPRPPA